MRDRVGAQAPKVAASFGEELDLLEQFGSTVVVERDAEIYGKGDASAWCWRVTTGCVRTVELLDDGRRHIGDFFLPGDLFGLDDLESRQFSAEAVTRTILRRYPRNAVEALARSHPALALRLAALTVANLQAAHRRMLLLSRKTSAERLATFVLEMDRRIGKPGDALLDLPMGRGDVADYLGLTKETVCRVLVQMAREGSIRLDRMSIALCNRASLHDQAGDRPLDRRCVTAPQVWRRNDAGASTSGRRTETASMPA
jgi:CRP-like cAMP-binding protein